jgi:hypothetical protein
VHACLLTVPSVSLRNDALVSTAVQAPIITTMGMEALASQRCSRMCLSPSQWTDEAARDMQQTEDLSCSAGSCLPDSRCQGACGYSELAACMWSHCSKRCTCV